MKRTNGVWSRPRAGVTMLTCVIVSSLALLAGCGGADSDAAAMPDDGDFDPSQKAAAATTLEAVEWIVYQQAVVDLPGASVIGFESTVLVAKQAGYVKSIGRQGDLEIDIGVIVAQGSVLAELHIPELEEELREKQAESRRALAEVAQSKAAAEIAIAMQEQVKQGLVEKQALRALREVGLQRISRLVKMGAADLDKQDEARFRHTAAIAAVKATEAEVVTAGANIRKAEADVAQAEAQAQVAAAAVKRLEALNSYRQIKAPFAGIVVARHVDPGAFVRPAGSNADGSPMFEVARIDRLRIVAFVSPSLIGEVHKGMKARFHNVGGVRDGLAISGQVDRTAMALDPSSRKMRIEMHVDNHTMDASNWLVIGQFGILSVLAKEWTETDKLAVVPPTAVAMDKQGLSFVVLVDESGGSRRVLVETVDVDAERVGVIGDFSPGDRVRVGDLSEY